MNPYKHPSCNFTYTAPPGTPPEECGDLPCILDRENRQVTSFWRPEPHERQAIIEGGDIVFTLQGIVHPPISLGVTIPTPEEKSLHTSQSYPSPGIQAIAIERQRQLTEKGWTAKHDDAHNNAELAYAGACYANAGAAVGRGIDIKDIKCLYIDGMDSIMHWPWDEDSFNPSNDPITNLVKAGALIAAELDRLIRLQNHPSSTSH
jgi:hypothetical protein